MTSTNRSAVLTAFGTPVSGELAATVSAALGATSINVASQLALEGGLGTLITKHCGSKDTLLVGAGSVADDAKLAASLGWPLIFVGDPGYAGVDLAVKVARNNGATIVGPINPDDGLAQAAVKAVDGVGDIAPAMNQAVFEHWLKTKAASDKRHIVLPEGDDDRIIAAAANLLADGVCELTILGKPDEIKQRAQRLNVDIDRAHLTDPEASPLKGEFADEFYELRKAKGISREDAGTTMTDISYFATMMIYKGLADGMVSGAAHTTAHTIKPSFQIIKTAPGVKTVSSVFLMVMPGKIWAFGDCAVNPNPTAEQLAEIAVVSAGTAAQFGIDPKVALLSYSTGTSGHGPDVDRVTQATKIAHDLNGKAPIDGPLQFDAAVDEGVAAKKAPDSAVAGHATVMIFPDLEAGNICYKAVQRTSGALAVGPILQGLKKPVNDLSRGATVADIVNTVAITAIQAQSH